MLKLKLQYFGHVMQRADSLEKTLMLRQTEGRRRRGWQRMRWLDGHHWLKGHESEKAPGDGEEQRSLACCIHGITKSQMTEWLNINNNQALRGRSIDKAYHRSANKRGSRHICLAKLEFTWPRPRGFWFWDYLYLVLIQEKSFLFSRYSQIWGRGVQIPSIGVGMGFADYWVLSPNIAVKILQIGLALKHLWVISFKQRGNGMRCFIVWLASLFVCLFWWVGGFFSSSFYQTSWDSS